MTHRSQMHANLMGPTRLGLEAKKRQRPERFEHGVARPRSARRATADRHSLTLVWMAADRPLEGSRWSTRHAKGDRQVEFLHSPVVKRPRQCFLRMRCARDKQNAGGLLVEPVNDSRPLLGERRGRRAGDARARSPPCPATRQARDARPSRPACPRRARRRPRRGSRAVGLPARRARAPRPAGALRAPRRRRARNPPCAPSRPRERARRRSSSWPASALVPRRSSRERRRGESARRA